MKPRVGDYIKYTWCAFPGYAICRVVEVLENDYMYVKPIIDNSDGKWISYGDDLPEWTWKFSMSDDDLEYLGEILSDDIEDIMMAVMI